MKGNYCYEVIAEYNSLHQKKVKRSYLEDLLERLYNCRNAHDLIPELYAKLQIMLQNNLDDKFTIDLVKTYSESSGSGLNGTNELKNKLVSMSNSLHLDTNYQPTITKGLNGIELADGYEIDYELDEFQAMGLNASAKSVEESVNEMILALIDSGEPLPPWKQTWAEKTKINAINFVSKKEYQGGNASLLNVVLAPIMPTPFYATFQQIKKLGGKVNKGAKAVPIINYTQYFKLKESTPDTVIGYTFGIKKKTTITAENKLSVSLSQYDIKKLNLKVTEYNMYWSKNYYRVFNLGHTTGIEYEVPKGDFTPKERIAKAEAIIKSMVDIPEILPHDSQAMYNLTKDKLYMPHIDQFDNAEEYYSTLFHELIHCTMHKSRLDREAKYKGKEEKSKYAFEELVAELGASYLCGLAGFLNQTSKNSASYLQGWHDKLKEATESDANFFIHATKEAQAGVDHIIKNYKEGKDDKPDADKEKAKAKARARARATLTLLKLRKKKQKTQA